MSYREEIDKCFREGSLLSANRQMSLDSINRCYTESGVVFICHDGKCVELEMEEDIMSKKYAIHPGEILKANGKRVSVDYNTLITLYGVDERDCFLWDKAAQLNLDVKNYVHLYPQPNGMYKLSNVLEGKEASYVPGGVERSKLSAMTEPERKTNVKELLKITQETPPTYA